MATSERAERLTVDLDPRTQFHRPIIADAAKEKLAKRQANAAVALLRSGIPDALRAADDMLHSTDAEARQAMSR